MTPNTPQTDRIEAVSRDLLRSGVAKVAGSRIVVAPGNPGCPPWVVYSGADAVAFGHELCDVAAAAVEMAEDRDLLALRIDRPLFLPTDADTAASILAHRRANDLTWFRAGWWLDEYRRRAAERVTK